MPSSWRQWGGWQDCRQGQSWPGTCGPGQPQGERKGVSAQTQEALWEDWPHVEWVKKEEGTAGDSKIPSWDVRMAMSWGRLLGDGIRHWDLSALESECLCGGERVWPSGVWGWEMWERQGYFWHQHRSFGNGAVAGAGGEWISEETE